MVKDLTVTMHYLWLNLLQCIFYGYVYYDVFPIVKSMSTHFQWMVKSITMYYLWLNPLQCIPHG